MFSCEYCKIFLNSFFYTTPLMAASEKYEYKVYMLDLLKDCCNCFVLSSIEKHLNEPIIYYNFSFLIVKLIKSTQSYLLLILQSFSVSSCFPRFSWSRFLWCRFFRVWVQVLEVAQLKCVYFLMLKRKKCENKSEVYKFHKINHCN